MDKIIKIYLLLSIISSCSQKTNYDDKKQNFKFVIERHITINFDTGQLKLNSHGLVYNDTLKFTKKEKSEIINLFDEYNLNNISNHNYFFDEQKISASYDDEIIVLKNNIVKSRFIINSNYSFNKFQFENNEVKIVKFRNLIKKIIERKKSYKQVFDSLKVFIKRKPTFVL